MVSKPIRTRLSRTVSELVVRCLECPKADGRSRIWRWLCQDCANECLERHKSESGHVDVHIQGERVTSIAELTSMLKITRRITGGW